MRKGEIHTGKGVMEVIDAIRQGDRITRVVIE
jgi:hypothetical protein